jgi:hypothetical protein
MTLITNLREIKHLLTKDILTCQEELINANLKEFAKF